MLTLARTSDSQLTRELVKGAGSLLQHRLVVGCASLAANSHTMGENCHAFFVCVAKPGGGVGGGCVSLSVVRRKVKTSEERVDEVMVVTGVLGDYNKRMNSWHLHPPPPLRPCRYSPTHYVFKLGDPYSLTLLSPVGISVSTDSCRGKFFFFFFRKGSLTFLQQNHN